MTVKEQWNMACPDCQADTNLEIEIKTGALLKPDGTDIFEASNGDHIWDDESNAQCHECGWFGKVADARTDIEATA